MKRRKANRTMTSLPDSRQWRDWTLCPDRFFNGDPESGEEYPLPYGGRLVDAVVVTGIGGYYKPGYGFGEALCRSADGSYFLVREVARSWKWREDRGIYGWDHRQFTLPADHFWLRVKKLTFRAALLYVTNGMSREFREDVFALLAGKEGA